MEKINKKNKKNIIFSFISIVLITLPIYLSSCYNVERDITIKKNYSDKVVSDLLIFDESNNSIIGYKKTLVPKRLSIPDKIRGFSVKQIAKNAFDGLKVEELNLPSSIEKINDNSFNNSEIDLFNFSNSNVKYLSPTAFNNSKISNFAGNIYNFNSEKNSIDGLLINPKQDYLFIPEQINGKDVIEISPNSFNYEITSFRFRKVFLPKTLKKVGLKAFYKQSIENLYISENLETIDDYAFAKNEINSIQIKGKNKNISNNAFEQDKIIQDIKVTGLLEGCNLYEYIKRLGIDQDKNFIFNKSTGAIEGIIQETPIMYIPEQIDGIVVKEIEKEAFLNKGIKELYLSKSLEVIKEDAFKQNEIQKIFIPKEVQKIEKGAFSYNKINEVLFDKDSALKSIGGFDHNKISGELIIPNTIEVIDKSAFANNFISKFIMPDKTFIIEENAFINNNIKELRVSKNIKEIKLAAFANNFMNSVVFEENSHISYLSGFNDNFIKGNLDISNLTNLKKIGTRAFESNSINSLVLNDNIRSIETRAFKNNNIVRIKNLGTNTILDNNWK